MGQLLSQPVTNKTTISSDCPSFSYVIGSCQGWRQTMEDAHCFINETIKINRNKPVNIYNNPNLGQAPKKFIIEKNEEILNLKVFGVFDGHGGNRSANFLSIKLPNIIVEEFQKNYLPNENNDVVHILKNCFFKADKELFDKNLQSGSTGIVAVILNDNDLYVCNTGDSRCILSTRNGSVKNLSFDHKPNNIGELIRIQDAGGLVTMNRVNGSLALSRAFGDFNFKKKIMHLNNQEPIYLPSEETQVTVEPEILNIKINFKNDEFLLLGCDGIWDSFQNKTICHIIRQKVSIGWKLDKISDHLIDTILKNVNNNTGVGFDNMTLIIVAVHDESQTLEQWYEKMKSKYETQHSLT